MKCTLSNVSDTRMSEALPCSGSCAQSGALTVCVSRRSTLLSAREAFVPCAPLEQLRARFWTKAVRAALVHAGLGHARGGGEPLCGALTPSLYLASHLARTGFLSLVVNSHRRLFSLWEGLGGGGGKIGKKHIDWLRPRCTLTRPGERTSNPAACPWLGIEPMTLGLTSQCSHYWAPIRARRWFSEHSGKTSTGAGAAVSPARQRLASSPPH